MNTHTLPRIGSVRRTVLDSANLNIIHELFLEPEQHLPLVMRPAMDGVDLCAWAKNNRAYLDAKLAKYGAILFRGFGINSVGMFHEAVTALSDPNMLPYVDASSPRSVVKGNIYTSTDYPPDQTIFLHNELSYASTFPMKIFFCCLCRADEGGETPIADMRKVYARIPKPIIDRFASANVMYVRNMGHGLGLRWQTVFNTSDKAEVERFCAAAGIAFEWTGPDALRTRQVRPAVKVHPVTGERIWFNHAVFFHISTLDPKVREPLLQQFKEEELPMNSFYGDGTPFEASTLQTLREAYAAETIKYPWEEGDVLMLDNMMVSHGRSTFKGPRKVVVAMTEPASH